MTLKEKVGQLKMPCLYNEELGSSIEKKLEGCRKFDQYMKEIVEPGMIDIMIGSSSRNKKLKGKLEVK
jgi:hypothetical protein